MSGSSACEQQRRRANSKCALIWWSAQTDAVRRCANSDGGNVFEIVAMFHAIDGKERRSYQRVQLRGRLLPDNHEDPPSGRFRVASGDFETVTGTVAGVDERV